MLGQEVVTLVDRVHDPGEYSVDWDGRDSHGKEVSSGIYFYKFLSEAKVIAIKRMVKLK